MCDIRGCENRVLQVLSKQWSFNNEGEMSYFKVCECFRGTCKTLIMLMNCSNFEPLILSVALALHVSNIQDPVLIKKL